MDPAYLGVLVMVGANKKNFKPTVTAIMERYYAKYRGKGGLEEGEVPQGTSGSARRRDPARRPRRFRSRRSNQAPSSACAAVCRALRVSLKDSPNVSLMSVFFAVYAPHLRNLPSTAAGNAECL